MLVSHKFSPDGQFLSVGRIKLRKSAISASSWQSLTSDLLLSNLRYVAGHIIRERDIYDFNGGFNLYEKNTGTCGDSLMNGHWEELFGKLEKLLHATDDPHNYRMLIQRIIEWSSDGEQHLESFLRLHVRKHVQGVIKAMLSSSASACASALVDLQQQLVDRAEWMCRGTSIIVDKAFEQVLGNHPDLCDAVNAQVSVLYQSLK